MSAKKRKTGEVREVDVNTSLSSAVKEGDFTSVKNLISGNAKIDPSLLHVAVKNGHVEIVKVLLDSGLDANIKNAEGKSPLCYSLDCNEEDKSVKIINLLLANGAVTNEAPKLLHAAVTAGFVEVCKILIKNGVDLNVLNENGKTPLHLTIPKDPGPFSYLHEQDDREKIQEANRIEIAKLLLKNGADSSIKTTTDGYTALHLAVLSEKKEVVSIFIDFRVYVDLRAEDGSTPLHLAAAKGHNNIVEILCKNHANVDARQNNGLTPLHCAAKGEGDILPLLDFGSDVNIETNDGKTALDLTVLYVKTSQSQVNREVLRDLRNEVMMERDEDGIPQFEEDLDYESSSDIEDYIDENFDPDEFNPVWTFKHHLIKLEAAGLFVSEKNLQMIDYNRYSNFKTKCEEEISRMTNEELYPSFALYNLLANSKTRTYVRNESLMQNLERFDFSKFPAYESLLRKNYEKSKARLELFNSGQESLNLLIKTSNVLNGRNRFILPQELRDQIVLYLTNSELHSLNCCKEALMRQVNQ